MNDGVMRPLPHKSGQHKPRLNQSKPARLEQQLKRLKVPVEMNPARSSPK
jgi:hypothetical protein